MSADFADCADWERGRRCGAAIAAQLAASVSAENMPALIAAIEQLALDPPANSVVDWSAVLAALGGM